MDDALALFDLLPYDLATWLKGVHAERPVIEVVADVDRPLIARHLPKTGEHNPFSLYEERAITADDLTAIAKWLHFDERNRAGIRDTLHRVSILRGSDGIVPVGMTMRLARPIVGCAEKLIPHVKGSLLIVGRAGVGKTSLLRDVCRLMASESRVMIVDACNEIAGAGVSPSFDAVGASRRIMVRERRRQEAAMIEAVENHMPQVIAVDEISSLAEATACRTVAERGVQLVATAHGDSIESVVQNPYLNILLGSVNAVTLSDDEAKKRGTSKTVRERKLPSTFDTVLIMQTHNTGMLYTDIDAVVDDVLANKTPSFIPIVWA